jgi:hypothetical protein
VSESKLPAWPSPRYESAGDAVAAAILASDPGDTVTVHASGCRVAIDEPCSCWPQVITVARGDRDAPDEGAGIS